MNTVTNALSYGGIVAVIGMLIVFLGLTILIICISIMGGIFKRKNQKKKSQPTPVIEAAPAPAAVPVVESVQEITDPQLIAVISAALAAFDQSGKRLVVRNGESGRSKTATLLLRLRNSIASRLSSLRSVGVRDFLSC